MTFNQRNKKYAARIDKVRGLLPIPEDRMKNGRQWRHVTVSSTHTPEEFLIETDTIDVSVEHTVPARYFIALHLPVPYFEGY